MCPRHPPAARGLVSKPRGAATGGDLTAPCAGAAVTLATLCEQVSRAGRRRRSLRHIGPSGRTGVAPVCTLGSRSACARRACPPPSSRQPGGPLRTALSLSLRLGRSLCRAASRLCDGSTAVSSNEDC